ncbi:CHAT domain-containing protein [Umezawaea tangerina]|uniref:CHAT domain-containing protein n=1 Tax=Umezawaea tangerina TaxID=84725 RepID=UPI0011B20160|nr:CHAT domain-containing protein [Umezawaea tangerina]
MLDAVRRRIARYRRGDVDAVLGKGVLADAGKLWRLALSPQGAPFEVLHALAELHWCRCLARADDNTGELWTALRLYAVLAEVDPSVLPDEVFRLLRGGPVVDPSSTGPEQWGRWAIRLLKRVQVVDDPAALDEVVELYGGTVEAFPPEHRFWPGDMSNLSYALRLRFDRRGDEADLDRAVEVARAAVRYGPLDDDLPNRVANLGAALTLRARHHGDTIDVAEAVQFATQSVRGTPRSHEFWAVHVSLLAGALAQRYALVGDPADLDEAVGRARMCVEALPEGHRERVTYQANLGGLLEARFRRTGRLADLDEAIDLLTRAVGATPPDSATKGVHLSNLATALLARHEHSDDPDDLDHALAAGRDATLASAPGDPQRPLSLANHGAALRRLHEVTGDPAALEEAVAAFREAVDLCPEDHPRRAFHVANLAGALLDRHDEAVLPAARRATWSMFGPAAEEPPPEPDAAALDEVVRWHRAALAASAPGHPHRGDHLNGLGVGLAARFSALRDPADADEAAGYFRQAIASGGLPRAAASANLASLLVDRDPADWDEAIALWRGVVEDPVAAPSARAGAAVRWAETAAGHGLWPLALQGYTAAIGMLGALATRGVDRSVRERRLAGWTGLAAEAAGCALNAGEPDLALELLEQGRGVLWSQLLDVRADLTALHAADPGLADRLAEVEAALETGPDLADPWWRRVADQRLRLAQERDELVGRVRSLPGFADFRRPMGAAELRRAAVDGPVVVVTASRWRCDALVVTADRTAVVPLAGLDDREAFERSLRYLVALQHFEATQDATARVTLNQHLLSTLDWLWRVVGTPVLAALGPVERVWWCPTGLLALLPLHAAGEVPDRVVSSYTPTVRALVESRARPTVHNGRMVAVGMAATPGQRALPQVAAELDELARTFPDALVLRDAEATVDAVRAALRTGTWAHLSCHGRQDLDTPSASGVELHDGRLTVEDLGGERFEQGEFAFLSACHTARGTVAVPDEAVTLASALHYTGWRHVVGTLWSVGATTAAEVSAEVYRELTATGAFDPARAAVALHHAVLRVRAGNEHLPITWAPLVHSGT